MQQQSFNCPSCPYANVPRLCEPLLATRSIVAACVLSLTLAVTKFGE